MKNVGTCLVYRVDESLSVFPGETSDGLDLIPVGEDGGYQGDPFVRSEGTENQMFPAWKVESWASGRIGGARRLTIRRIYGV